MSSIYEEDESFAKEIIIDALKKWDLDSIGISFTGGKDSIVMLHIITLLYPNHPFRVYYFLMEDSFEEERTFITERIPNIYPQLKISVIREGVENCTTMLKGLEYFLLQNPNLTLMIIGVRGTDVPRDSKPYSSIMESECPWPPGIIRCHPILHFSYQSIWSYIDRHNLEYISLYDKGYTSIGTRSNTFPNPSLKNISNNTFAEARTLLRGEDERLGRIY